VFDYQQAIINQAESGSDGFVNIDLKRKAILLVAKMGKRKRLFKTG
jgi:hypothetical protein